MKKSRSKLRINSSYDPFNSMPSWDEIAEESGSAPSSGSFRIRSYDARWKGRVINLSDHAAMECRIFKLDVLHIVDMLDASFPCPKSKRFHRKDKIFNNIEDEVCCKKDKKTFRIIYCEDDCIDVREICWLIIHVKPTR